MRPDYQPRPRPTDPRRATSRAAALLAVLLAATSAGCGGDGDGPGVTNPPVARADPGPVTLRLAAPEPASRAVLVELSGAGVDSVTSPLRVVGATAESATRRLILNGPVAAGTVATVWLADRRALAGVTARVTQAIGDDYRQRDLTSFALSLVR